MKVCRRVGTLTRLALALPLTAALALVGCGAAADLAGGSGTRGTWTFWDPYPQFGPGDAWPELVARCGERVGVEVERSGYETTDLTHQTRLAAQQGDAPDIVVIDNPAMPALAQTGVLVPVEELGLETAVYSRNILDAGVVDGKVYGVPIGANTLALYYNADILADAGVDPASLTDWDALEEALEAVTGAGHEGIALSALGSESGVFQFLPWFWGSGAELTDLDSADAVEALSLWTRWVEEGYAPDDVLNTDQTGAWDRFATGRFAFGESGTWNRDNAEQLTFPTGVIPIPEQHGGVAPTPTGGEFAAAPVQEDPSRYDTTAALIACLTSPENLLATDRVLSYVAPIRTAQQEQIDRDPEWEPWVDAVRTAQSRTGDGLGRMYPAISERLSSALQNALSGAQTPERALENVEQRAGYRH